MCSDNKNIYTVLSLFERSYTLYVNFLFKFLTLVTLNISRYFRGNMSRSVFRAKEENKIKQRGNGSGNRLPEAIFLLAFCLASCSSSMQSTDCGLVHAGFPLGLFSNHDVNATSFSDTAVHFTRSYIPDYISVFRRFVHFRQH
jgi:hypothetical protein